ncbi:ABC transporter permease [Microbacterium sp. E-13]|uniref:ABC transporter permease n=1 Tax=Microbacterium sp. E-13 TaxID=3404048 RepID=UPI003CEA7411
MLRYLGFRLGQAVLVILIAFTLTFFLLFLAPGDAALARIGGDASASPEELAALRAELGLDQPWYVSYIGQLGALLTLQFGESLRNGRPVTEIIGEALPNTVQVAGLSMLLAIVLGVAIAVTATYTRARWLRGILLSLPALGLSIPTFWLGVLMLTIFAFQLRWFPAFGSDDPLSVVLPVITLGIVCSAGIAQVLATSLLEASRSPYAFTAMTKGASRWRLLLRHCLRAASVPMLTMVGLLTGALLTGSVVIEIVFSRSGIGREILQGVDVSDFPVVQGIVMICAIIFVGVNLVVDLLYPVLDPRMRAAMRG